MKNWSWKKAVFALGVGAIAAGAAMNVGIRLKGNALSDIQLANVEALAYGEDPCQGYKNWTHVLYDPCPFPVSYCNNFPCYMPCYVCEYGGSYACSCW